jgi:DNA helicase HerA-like ATPase
MGRSRNTALILVSQNAGDLLNEQVTNCLSAVFAFRSTERGEVASVMSLLGVDSSEEHQAVLRSLGNGECIFRDLDGRAGRIDVDLISDDLRRWLDTNPTRATSAQVPVSESAAGRGQGGERGGSATAGASQRAGSYPGRPVAANGQQSARSRPPSPVQAPAP